MGDDYLNKVQELVEGIAINAMNGGALTGTVFRHNDADAKALSDVVIAEASTPIPNLEGFRGFRVEVTIEIKSSTPAKNAVTFGQALGRMINGSILRAAALQAGLRISDDLELLNEEISGDRSNTNNVRKRTLVVPFLINPQSLLDIASA